MKKLKLNLSNMKGKEILTREQLKKVMGGDGSGDGSVLAKCTVKCADGKEKSRDCGTQQCSTDGTKITCGASDTKEMC